MIARHETTMDKMDIWARLSAPLPTGVISWRQDGRAVERDGATAGSWRASWRI